MEPNFVKIPGYVWCDIHCGVHTPLTEGENTCSTADHRSVYFDRVLASAMMHPTNSKTLAN
jgi:hypothetical protein